MIRVWSARTATAARGRSRRADRIPAAARYRRGSPGTGEDETAALRDLDDRLRGVPKPNGTRLEELRQRLRLAYVDGAESWAIENLGRGLDRDELGRVIGRYVGR